MRNRLKTVYYLGWGNCSEAMRSKLQSLTGSKQLGEDYDAIALVKLIQSATFNFEKRIYIYNLMNNIQKTNRCFFQR